MKKIVGIFVVAAMVLVGLSAHANEKMDHSMHNMEGGSMEKMDGMKGHDMDKMDQDMGGKDMKGMDHSMHGSDRIGTLVHESKVEGYTLAYYFMDMRDMEGHSMGNMEDKPHHIMVYITDAKGRVVEKAKVGLWIRSGDGMDQKTMTMYMSNGFGTMADLKKPGKYTVSTKVVMGGKKLMDR